jgi:hypothetical protein
VKGAARNRSLGSRLGYGRGSPALEANGAPGRRPRVCVGGEGAALTWRRVAAIGAACRHLGCVGGLVVAGVLAVSKVAPLGM